jgi:diketogulonate reductase-like aldo/keto reductase
MHSAIGGPQLREESWRAFEWAKKEKLVRSIGVSNCASPARGSHLGIRHA